MQQTSYPQHYQQPLGSMGMQSMPSSSYGMPNANMPVGSMGMPGNAPWQAETGGPQQQQQQPWGMAGQAPGYGQYPQPGMGSMPMAPQMPGKLLIPVSEGQVYCYLSLILRLKLF